jgi:gluconokinase
MFDGSCNGMNMSRVVIVTGVSGAGKTTVGKVLADRLGWDFFDADHYHPEENIRRMESGVALDDADRMPWLESLQALIDIRLKQKAPAVLACSALRASYRTMLSEAGEEIDFVLLKVDPATLKQRLESRPEHFMSATLLQSQLATLEPGEDVLTIDATVSVSDVVDMIMMQLDLESDLPS